MYFLIFDKKFRGGIFKKKNSSGNSGIRLLVIAPKNDP
jgi:hypothetical protein